VLREFSSERSDSGVERADSGVERADSGAEKTDSGAEKTDSGAGNPHQGVERATRRAEKVDMTGAPVRFASMTRAPGWASGRMQGALSRMGLEKYFRKFCHNRTTIR